MPRIALAAAVMAALIAAPHAIAQTPSEIYAKTDPSVFGDFGGLEGLRALMEEFERELIRNPTTRPFFANRDNTRTKQQLVQQFCDIMQGGCVYLGATMRDSHREMGVNQAHFYALVEALQVAMSRQGIPFRSQNKLLAVLAPMNRDIITR
jgi:hemoglobin